MRCETRFLLKTPATQRGRERCDTLIESAYQLFLRYGYEPVTLDDIIKHAGGSKSSVYNYFGDKEGLFKAVCDYHFEKKMQAFNAVFQDHQDLKTYLTEILMHIYHLYQEEESVAFFHLLINQSRPNPEIMQYLNEKWHNEIQQNVNTALYKAHQSGQIHCPNPTYAGVLFLGILHQFHWQAVMGVDELCIDDMEKYIHYSVEFFLQAHQYKFISL